MNVADSNLHELMRLARQGETKAISSLIELYRNYLWLLARHQIDRRLQGKLDASDVVQESFLESHRDFAQFQGTTEQELLAWLRRILSRSLIDSARRFATRRRDVSLEQTMERVLEQSSRSLAGGLVAAGSSPSQVAARREQAVLLADCLAQLPEDYREVILLRQMDGLSFPEVAKNGTQCRECAQAVGQSLGAST